MNDADKIKKALEAFTYGVYIVSAKRGKEINALAAGMGMQISFSPPLVLVGIGKTRYTHDMIEEGKVFAVSVLAEGQQELGRHFGSRSGRDVDKFADVPHRTARTGAPILEECAAWLDCELVGSHAAGDHTIFVGKVVEAWVDETKKPLVLRAGDYE